MTAALLVAAVACAYISTKTSDDELHGAYRDSAATMLQAAGTSFEREHGPDAGARPDVLRGDLRPALQLLGERNDRLLRVLGVLLVCFTLVTLLVLQRGIFRPLGRLRLAAQAVGAGDLGTRVGWQRRDELGELARDFDAMAAHLEENHRRLDELAYRDPLTGLANHRRFQELLGEELDVARRHDRPLAAGVAHGQGWALARPGQPWPRVNGEAARLSRELRSEQARIVPLGSMARERRGA